MQGVIFGKNELLLEMIMLSANFFDFTSMLTFRHFEQWINSLEDID